MRDPEAKEIKSVQMANVAENVNVSAALLEFILKKLFSFSEHDLSFAAKDLNGKMTNEFYKSYEYYEYVKIFKQIPHEHRFILTNEDDISKDAIGKTQTTLICKYCRLKETSGASND